MDKPIWIGLNQETPMSPLNLISGAVLLLGGLEWGLFGVLNFNFLAALAGRPISPQEVLQKTHQGLSQISRRFSLTMESCPVGTKG